ncbi:MAG: radical SAM protein [Ruminococcaceae bacterium]|nr:radical SAM protein [Oscillospiraceae bacterium]
MLNISKIQHFSVGDGEGIRTTVFFKGCNLRCPWCHNPENLSGEPVSLHYRATNKTEVLGQLLSAEELLPELLEDKAFFDESNGGVTFSGGEAMLQAARLVPLARTLRENGVSLLVDTAGCVPYALFQELNPFVTGYLFDFKTSDAQKYSEIGGDLSRVVDNLRRLREDRMTVFIRIPLIPGFNTSPQATHAICECLRELSTKHVDLLPFHRLGSAKYEAMGLDYPYRAQHPLTKEELGEIEAIYKTYFSVKIER